MSKKIISLWILCLLSIIPVIVNAQETQEASVTISPGSISIVGTPDDFSFGTIFINPSTTVPTYQTLDPTVSNQILAFDDADITGLDFNITIAMTNFVDAGKVIPFTDFSFVTLSDDPSGVDPYTPASPPAGSVDVTAPMDCAAWSGDLQTDCDTTLNAQPFPANIQNHAADPASAINSTTTVIPVTDETVYTVNEIIELASGEKALITNILAGAPDEIMVKRGILGTTAASQGSGSGIDSYGINSLQETIIDAPEPVGGRFGAYSVGFGLRGDIQPYFEPGNYSGIITYTLYVL